MNKYVFTTKLKDLLPVPRYMYYLVIMLLPALHIDLLDLVARLCCHRDSVLKHWEECRRQIVKR